MSGIFKNFDKLVCASNFSKANPRFLVKSPLFNFQPAALYYTPLQKLTRGHSHDTFELAQISYQLTRQLAKQRNWLANIEQEQNQQVHQELKQKCEVNQEFVNSAVEEIQLQFKSNVSQDNSIETLTNFVYVLSHLSAQNLQKKYHDVFEKYLYQQIMGKIQYASQQNLSDLVQGLVGLGIYNEDIWNATLSAFKSKTLNGQYENVDYHAWELDQYQYSEKQKSLCQSAEEQFFNEVAQGNNSPTLSVKRKVIELFEQIYLKALNPFFFRESRPNAILYAFDLEAEKENTVKALRSAAEQIPEAGEVAQYISSRY